MDELLHKVANWIKSQDKKVMIGISGHGASGKTSFANNLIKLLGENEVNYLNTDPYIVSSTLRKNAFIDYEYNNENHHFKMTACHPDAHHLLAIERDIKMIRANLDIYTIGTNYMKSTLLSSKKSVSIVEGMSVAFIHPDLFDLKIYLYTDGKTELARRGIRDVSERSADINFLRQSHEERRIQYELFMHPYHEHFDIVIKNSNEAYSLVKDQLNGSD
ncbi:uridine kinase family protein [Evansella halocellulosilytica]|uniref:uridine kinase family protein n=1 Tax=Evansella halocellulosilytica TaxID=2011013 RepID=UPI000BB6D44F|nr:phosphoribulokinase [Evansella halocellulosilytica]